MIDQKAEANERRPDSTGPGRPERLRNWMRRHRVELLLFVLLWTTYAYFYQSTQHNEAARLDQTRALVQDQTLLINKYWWNSADVIHYQKNGTDHIYPAKAPGMSLLAVVPFAILAKVWGIARFFGMPEWVYWHLLTYSVVLFTVGLFSAAAAVVTYRILKRATNDSYFALLVILAIWLATLAFPFGTLFFSHQMTASLLAIAFYLLLKLRRQEIATARGTYAAAGGGGLLMGLAVLNEYPAAVPVLLLSVYVLWFTLRWKIPFRQEAKVLGVWMLGGLVGGLTLVLYNLLAFGKPFYIAYEALTAPGTPFPTHKHGWVGFAWPGFENFLEAVTQFMVVPPVGLLYLTIENWRIYACNPVLWLALPGLGVMIWKKEWRAEGLLILGLVLAYLVFISCYGTSIYDWAGASYLGPRHIIPLLPFLALPLYFGARHLRFLFYPLFVVSLFYMLLATAIEPRVPTPFEIPARDFLLPDYLRGRFAQNTFNLFDGANHNLTRDSTAFNLAKLARFPGKYQLMPLVFWWLAAGGLLLYWARRAGEKVGSEAHGRRRWMGKVSPLFLVASLVAMAVAPALYSAMTAPRDTSRGLLGKYFRNLNWSGEPNEVQVDAEVDFDWSKSWPLPAPFSVEWTGNLLVPQAGEYTFFLKSDDGAMVEIDNRTVVNALQGALLQERSGSISLTPGPHRIRLRYINELFGGSVRFSWSLIGRPKEIVPTEVLIPEAAPGPSPVAR